MNTFRKPMPEALPLGLPGVFLIESRVWKDERGWFTESWQSEDFAQLGLAADFVQDNLVMNERAGILRGLHWQSGESSQTKLIRCIAGEIFDVVADIRPDSPTYRQWIGVPLKANDGRSLFIPAGYAHGYVTRREGTLVFYKVDRPWDKASERSVRWNDPALGIVWGIDDPLLSEKDASAPYLEK